MSKSIIAVDVDDVLADSTNALRRLVNDRTDMELTADHYAVPGDYRGYYERVWAEHGVDMDFESLSNEMIEDQSHIPILAGAALALTELSKRFDLIIITSREVSWKEATLVWLEANCKGLFKDIIFTADGEIAKTKGELCKELRVSWLIDDNPEHCKSAIDQGVKTLLFGKYGWHYNAPKDLTVCVDWPAVLEFFDGRS